MKTLEQVKEYFKNAKDVRCLNLKITFKIDIDTIDNKAVNIWCKSINGSFVQLYDNSTNQFAEIISYKENPIQHDDFNEHTKEIIVNDAEIVTPKHYDNSKGSLYLFAENNNLNSWEFDVIKRIVRCRKKGNFKEDIEKTINVLKLYLDETKI